MVGFTSMPLSCCDLQPGRSCLSSKRTLIYKVSMEEARWGAVCPDTFLLVLMIHVKCSLFRAKAAQFSRHLPPGDGYKRLVNRLKVRSDQT